MYTFTYDEFGNVSSIKVGSRTLATYEYGIKNGTLNSTTYGTNETLSYTYDALERVTGIKENGVLKYSWEYGNDGRIGRFIDHTLLDEDEKPAVTKYFYDSNGNVVDEERNNGKLYNEYDENQLLKSTGFVRGNIYTTTNNSIYSKTSFTYNPREEVETIYWDTNYTTGILKYTRDSLRRIASATHYLDEDNEEYLLQTNYEYIEITNQDDTQDTRTTNVLSSVENLYGIHSNKYQYGFDDVGNISSITSITDSTSYTNTYEYDALNQLVRENNQELNKTYTFSYDYGGNLLEAKTYNYTTNDLTNVTPLTTETYGYTDSSWKDLLTSYNGNPITYDSIGNPLTYHDGKQFTWNFRRLEQIVDGNNTYSYTYNQDGVRTSKMVNGESTYYFVSGNRIIHETRPENKVIVYEYDAQGSVNGFEYYGHRFTYIKNGTNDIIGILNLDGELVATYSYDGWGNCTVNNLTSSNIGDLNPFRYRSYYYDVETGYYYLNSRYYDSNVGRFINSDEVSNLGVNNDVASLNIYAYCANNPIHRIDDGGDVWEVILFGALVGMGTQIISNVIEDKPWYEEVVGATVGGAVSVACGGLGGIMFGNAASISLNYIEARICGREYSDNEAASDLVGNILFEVGIGLSTGTIIEVIDPDTMEPTTKFDQYFKYDTSDKIIKKSLKNGRGFASTVMDTGRKIGIQYTFDKRKRDKLHDYFFGE